MDAIADAFGHGVYVFVREVGLALAIVAFGLGGLFAVILSSEAAPLGGGDALLLAPMLGTAVAGWAGGRRLLHVLFAAFVSGATALLGGLALSIMSFF